MQGSWQAGERGAGQLHELNSMIRRQEGYFGSSFALFLIANAVLVFAYYQQENHHLARTAISLVALVTNGALFVLLMEAKGHLELWKRKALALESDLGVPQDFRIWGDAPKGMVKTKVGPMAVAALLVYWAVCLAYSVMNYVL